MHSAGSERRPAERAPVARERSALAVLLISCYELGHQPLSLASPAARLLARGHDVECLDLQVEPFDEARVRRASFIAISTPMHTAIGIAIRCIKRVKVVAPTAHVCVYGLYASLNAAHLFSCGADTVVGGEFEGPLAALVDALSEGRAPELPGVRRPGAPPSVYLGRSAKEADQYLLPARHLLPPLDRYARLLMGGERRLVGYVEASHGCAHHCLHCPITPVYAGRLRLVGEDPVLADIEQLVRLGARHITFGDPDFLNGVRHSISVIRRVHRMCPDLTFDITTRVEHILEQRRLIPEIKELGCVFIQSAFESLSDHVLTALNKGHTEADVLGALRVARAAGVDIRASLVAFTPWTTVEDYLRTLDIIEGEGLIYNVDPVQYAIRLLVPEGSSLLGTPQLQPYLREFNGERLVYEWEHPDPRMDVLYEDVFRVIEAAAKHDRDPMETFFRVKSLALSAAAGRVHRGRAPAPAAWGSPPPRLTEAWFC